MGYLALAADSTTYHVTATSAVLACGAPKWDCAATVLKLRALQPGDELNINEHASVIVLSGVEVDA